jgi:cytosine/adenosine deaminase-related metal-dependent hydrolase
VDLGDAVLLPGLVNAHCHLDYTNLAGKLAPPKSFTDWIKGLVALKGAWTLADFAQSWTDGAQMLLRSGTTTVADIEALPDLAPAIWDATPLRVISFRELICLKGPPAARSVFDAAVTSWSGLARLGRVGLSPHAPYTTTPALLQLAARHARRRRWRLVTHVAECREEFDMFAHRKGSLFDWLAAQRDMADCGLGSPIQHLARCGYLGPNVLAVHANYLARGDARLLGQNQVSVVHCPRCHAYFGHAPFARATLAAAGVNICLGTDSLVSTRKERPHPLELNLFKEMSALAQREPGLSPRAILRWATVNGARALGLAGELGQLAPGALADLIAIPFAGRAAQAYEAVIHHPGPASAAMIAGKWAIPPVCGSS